MIIHFILFLFVASVAVVMTPVARRVSVLVGAVDRPDERKVHRKPMPRLGGLAIVTAFVVPVLLVYLFNPALRIAMGLEGWSMAALLGGGLLIALLGALDDIRGLRARTKFVVQLAVAAGAWALGARIEHMGLPFLGVIDFPAWLGFLVTVLWIAGVINALNLIDGLDGLAAGVAFIVAVTNIALAARGGNQAALFLSSAVAGAVVGFLLFNWNPAIVFMGDTGSMFLGYVLATTAVMTSQKVSTAVAMVVPIIALGVPVLDTLLAMVRRFLERRPLFSPDKGHLHHRLLRLGLTQKRAVLIIYALCIVFAAAAILMTSRNNVETAVALGIVVVVVVGIVRFFGFFNLSAALKRTVGSSRLARAVRRQLPGFYTRAMSECRTAGELWRALVDTARDCGLDAVSWQVVGAGGGDTREQRGLRAHDSGRKLKLHTSVALGERGYVEMSFRYPARLSRASADDEQALELLADAVAAGIRKLQGEGRPGNAGHPPPSPSPARATEPESGARGGREEDREAPAPAGKERRPGRAEVLDSAWKLARRLAVESGFVEIAWRSHGIKPPDERRQILVEADGGERARLTRSVPIDSLAFLEMSLTYPGRPGRKTPDSFRQSARRIGRRIAEEIRRAR